MIISNITITASTDTHTVPFISKIGPSAYVHEMPAGRTRTQRDADFLRKKKRKAVLRQSYSLSRMHRSVASNSSDGGNSLSGEDEGTHDVCMLDDGASGVDKSKHDASTNATPSSDTGGPGVGGVEECKEGAEPGVVTDEPGQDWYMDMELSEDDECQQATVPLNNASSPPGSDNGTEYNEEEEPDYDSPSMDGPMSQENMFEMDMLHAFSTCGPMRSAWITREFTRETDDAHLGEVGCASCSALVLVSEARVGFYPSDELMATMCRVLVPCADSAPLGDDLEHFYDQSLYFPGLAGAIVCALGVMKAPGDSPAHEHLLSLCNSCLGCLEASPPRKPKFSAANGNFMCVLPPHLADATYVERAMTSRLRNSSYVSTLRSGSRRLHSHTSTYDNGVDVPASQLPRMGADAHINVVFAGAFTPAEKTAAMKVHSARFGKMRGLVEHYVTHNQTDFEGVTVPPELLQFDVDSPEQDTSIHATVSGRVGDEIAEEHARTVDSVRNPTSLQSGTAPVCTEHTSRVVDEGLRDDTGQLRFLAASLLELDGDDGARPRRFVSRSSNKFVSDREERWFEKVFTHLFPYGRGGPAEPRDIKISLKELILYYLRHGGRQFALDKSFVVVAFDVLARKESSLSVYLHCRYNKQDAAQRTAEMTAINMMDALEYKQSVEDAIARNLPTPPP
jgi:hypothetical protein